MPAGQIDQRMNGAAQALRALGSHTQLVAIVELEAKLERFELQSFLGSANIWNATLCTQKEYDLSIVFFPTSWCLHVSFLMEFFKYFVLNKTSNDKVLSMHVKIRAMCFKSLY